MAFTDWEVLQKNCPRIVLKTLTSVPAGNSDEEPNLVVEPIGDPELLEWAAGVVLRDLNDCGEIPKYSFGARQVSEGGYKIMVIVTEIM